MLQICVKLFTIKIFKRHFPANTSLFKVNNRNTRKRCEICSKLIIETRIEYNRTDVVLEFLSLTLNLFHTFF